MSENPQPTRARQEADLRIHANNLHRMAANYGSHTSTGIVASVAAFAIENFLDALAASSPASQEPVAKVTSRYMRAYYHEFEPTGMDRIDAILEAVAMAGRAYHSTELWDEAPEFGECGYWTLIQERAVAAATPETPGREDALRASERDVIAERRRQVEVEGWTPEHDDRHSDGELARAAGVYALASGHHDYRWVLQGLPVSDYLAGALKLWPWDWSWFKPKHRRQDLVKAGALILAEIERLDRAALAQPGPDARDEEGRDDA